MLSLLVKKNDRHFRTLYILLITLSIASVAEAGLLYSNGNIMLASFLAKQFTAPMIIPALLLYHSSLSNGRRRKYSAHTWIAIPILLLFVEIILIILAGTDSFIDSIDNYSAKAQQDKIEQLIHLCTYWIFYGILAIEVILWLFYAVIKAIKKSFHAQLYNGTVVIITYSLLETVIISKGNTISWYAYAICIILSVSIFILSYNALSDDIYRIVPEDMSNNSTTDPDTTTGILSPAVTTTADTLQSQADEETLRYRFENLILSKQLFLKQGIRVTDVASMLNTNRTYISKHVNDTYGMSFSDYINTLRINYAEQYLLQHNDARQSDIATSCGFPNASAFNNIFKKMKGVTPKIWLATNSKTYNQQ